MTAPDEAERATRDAVRGAVQSAAGDLLRFFARRVQRTEDAADLLGETLLTTWRRARELPADPEDARKWMYGVAQKVLANHHRGRRRHDALLERLRGTAPFTQLSREVLADAFTENQDRRLDVAALINELPEPDRSLIQLVHWEGFSLAECAEILELNPATARSRYARARTRLKQLLQLDQDDS